MDMLGKGARQALALAVLGLLTVGAARAADDDPPKKAATLGLATQRISDTWREKNAYKASGVLVIGVDPAGRAAKGGISTGDVLVSVDGRTLREPSDLGYAERKLQPDQPVAIVLARDGGHSIKMFDIAPLSDAGPGISSTSAGAMATGIAVEPTSPAATPPEPTGSSVIIDTAPAAGAVATLPDPAGSNSVEPVPTLIIARADTSTAPGAAQASGKTGAAELGVRGQALDPDLATALGAEGAEGVLVLEVVKESPADHAGLRAGDVIFKVGDESVKDMETLDEAVVAATNPAAINMLRRGDQQMVLAPLDGHPAPANAGPPEAAPATPDQEQVINELKGEVATLKKELADLKQQIAKLIQDSAKPKP